MIEVPHFLVSIPALKNLLHSCSEAATRESVLTCTSAVTRWNICQTIFCDAPKVLSDCSTFSLEAVACKYDDNFYFLLYKIDTILFVYSGEASFVFHPVRSETRQYRISASSFLVDPVNFWLVGWKTEEKETEKETITLTASSFFCYVIGEGSADSKATIRESYRFITRRD